MPSPPASSLDEGDLARQDPVTGHVRERLYDAGGQVWLVVDGERTSWARLDPGQVGEAVRLLIINAFEAVADGGHVEIGAAAQFATEAVEIEILDDGPGMDPETAARACDPFFSGREAGRGIGMGLPKALRLIEANGGRLEIAVRPGRGTRCGIWLPLAVPVG